MKHVEKHLHASCKLMALSTFAHDINDWLSFRKNKTKTIKFRTLATTGERWKNAINTTVC